MHKYSIMIVDDHKLFREGLKLLLKNLPVIKEVVEASDAEEFLQNIGSREVDLIFMDIDLPGMDGIEATYRALEMNPQLNIVALTMYGDEDYYTRMVCAGAKGFILKNSSIQEMETAIINVMEGKPFVSQELLPGLIQKIGKKRSSPGSAGLSSRESEVLYHICKGLSNQEIADILYLSKRTVDKHRENLLAKTQSKNTAGLVMYAIRHGIVDV